jgi:hypothetical protein
MTTAPGWSTDPRSTSSISTMWESAPLTNAAVSAERAPLPPITLAPPSGGVAIGEEPRTRIRPSTREGGAEPVQEHRRRGVERRIGDAPLRRSERKPASTPLIVWLGTAAYSFE